MSRSRLPTDPVRVHDRLIEEVVARHRRHPSRGGVAIQLPAGLERLMFASGMLHRLRVDSRQRPHCLMASNDTGVIHKIRKFQGRRYRMPTEVVCPMLGSGDARRPQHLCSFSEFNGLRNHDLTAFDAVIMLCTDSPMLNEQGFQSSLRQLAKTKFVVLVANDPIPRVVTKTLDLLTVWKWV